MISGYAYWAITTICLCILTNRIESSHLRGEQDDVEVTDSQNHRTLNWIWLPQSKVHQEDPWYNEYDDREAKQVEALGIGDPKDFLRDGDICPKKGQSGLKRSYCPTPPDCSWSGQFGQAKLCITRLPMPSDRSKFYVVSMKCIPKWENCDKCVCGAIHNDKCKFDGSKWDDDKTEFDCNKRTSITMNGYTYAPP